jgi:hypothetical protein
MLLLVSIFVELLQATGMAMLPHYVYSIVASQGNRMVCKYLSAESMSQTPRVPLLYSHLVRASVGSVIRRLLPKPLVLRFKDPKI